MSIISALAAGVIQINNVLSIQRSHRKKKREAVIKIDEKKIPHEPFKGEMTSDNKENTPAFFNGEFDKEYGDF